MKVTVIGAGPGGYQAAIIAVYLGLTAEQVGDCIHAHPTLSEAIMEAAHDVHGVCIHKG